MIKLQARLDPARADEAPSSMQAFVCGLAAGMLAKLGTHPLDVAKKRFQVGQVVGSLARKKPEGSEQPAAMGA